MKKLLIALAATTMLTTSALAEDVKIGVILGFTGPIESLTPDMAAGAELAMKEVSDSGALLGGSKVSRCVVTAPARTPLPHRLLLSVSSHPIRSTPSWAPTARA